MLCTESGVATGTDPPLPHPSLSLSMLTLTLTLDINLTLRSRFLLGWVIRGTQTRELLEAGAQVVGLDWTVLQTTSYMNIIYGIPCRHKLFTSHAHERENLKIWEFRWKASSI